jgi:hypothetical protein
VANREEVVLSAGFDGAKLEQGAKKAFGTVDREAQKAGAALGKFGLSGEGVLTKLARTLSLTDIAAGAVFATIAKGQAVVRDSLKAFEDYDRKVASAHDGVMSFSESMDEANRVIQRNNVLIGQALSPLAEMGKNFETAASSGIVAFATGLSEFGARVKTDASMKAAVVAAALFGGPMGIALAGTIGIGVASSGASGPTFGTSSGGGASGAGGETLMEQLAREAKERSDAERAATEAIRERERAERNALRFYSNIAPFGPGAATTRQRPTPGFGNPFEFDIPLPGGGDGDSPAARRIDDEIKAYEEAQRRSQEFREQFAANIGSGLSSAILDSQNFAQAIGNIFKQTFAKILSDAGGSLFSSLLGGGPIGIFASLSTGRTAPGVTPATQSMARTLAPAMRREASVGRGF